MSDTLVIHPYDKSTIMLEYVYKDLGFDVIRDPNLSKQTLIDEIKKHKRIIMLGHGTPHGLIHPELMRYFRVVTPGARPIIIDDSFADLLREKETISMWCYSDEYFKRNHIKGFHTGMIISEVSEAYYMLGYSPLNERELFENMIKLSKCLHDSIDKSAEEMRDYILTHYDGQDDISKFNRRNITVL